MVLIPWIILLWFACCHDAWALITAELCMCLALKICEWAVIVWIHTDEVTMEEVGQAAQLRAGELIIIVVVLVMWAGKNVTSDQAVSRWESSFCWHLDTFTQMYFNIWKWPKFDSIWKRQIECDFLCLHFDQQMCHEKKKNTKVIESMLYRIQHF